MITVKKFVCNPLQENTYVVSDDSRECVVIDCGAFFDDERKAIVSYINTQQLKPVRLLCTHGHFDHIFGCDTIFYAFGLQPEVHSDDAYLTDDVNAQVKQMLGADLQLQMPAIGHYLTDGEVITFGHHQLKVLHTPGHTPGGVVFYCEQERTAFSGDTLFRMSIGRTDFEKGSYEQIIDSLHNVIAKLPADTTVYTGHGPLTVVGEEVAMSPYFR
jgi:glyoxylase-like metal-dependent hydrolase (beta-lactamase superfamily II)